MSFGSCANYLEEAFHINSQLMSTCGLGKHFERAFEFIEGHLDESLEINRNNA